MNFLIKIFNKLNTNNTGIFRIIHAYQAKNYTLHYDTIENAHQQEKNVKASNVYLLLVSIHKYLPIVEVRNLGLQPTTRGYK